MHLLVTVVASSRKVEKLPPIPRRPKPKPAGCRLHQVILALATFVFATAALGQNCFRWDGKINGQPVRLLLDTGCNAPVMLARPAGERLGLRLEPVDKHSVGNARNLSSGEAFVELPDRDGKKGYAEKCQVFESDMPWISAMDGVDGALGWPLLRERIIRFEAAEGQFHFLNEVPKEAKGWPTFAIRDDKNGMLELAAKKHASKPEIFIDTGDVGMGARALCVPLPWWHELKKTNPNMPIGLSFYCTPDGAMGVAQRGWVDRFSLGTLQLTNVAIERGSRSPSDEVCIGFQTLKKFALVVGGKHHLAYLRATEALKPEPPLDRVVVVFHPLKFGEKDLIGHVADDRSAAEGGVQNGDVLVGIDHRDLTRWLADPEGSWVATNFPTSKGFLRVIKASANSPVNAEIGLTLRRGNQTVQARVPPKSLIIAATISQNNSGP
jgi:hypothetical protein